MTYTSVHYYKDFGLGFVLKMTYISVHYYKDFGLGFVKDLRVSSGSQTSSVLCRGQDRFEIKVKGKENFCTFPKFCSSGGPSARGYSSSPCNHYINGFCI